MDKVMEAYFVQAQVVIVQELLSDLTDWDRVVILATNGIGGVDPQSALRIMAASLGVAGSHTLKAKVLAQLDRMGGAQ